MLRAGPGPCFKNKAGMLCRASEGCKVAESISKIRVYLTPEPHFSFIGKCSGTSTNRYKALEPLLPARFKVNCYSSGPTLNFHVLTLLY